MAPIVDQYSHRKRFPHGLQRVALLLVPLYLALVTAAAALIHSAVHAPEVRTSGEVSSSHAAPGPADQGLAVVNRIREGQGHPQLRYSAAAAALARSQSLAMARDGRVFQQSCLACTKLRMAWGSIEENVGSRHLGAGRLSAAHAGQPMAAPRPVPVRDPGRHRGGAVRWARVGHRDLLPALIEDPSWCPRPAPAHRPVSSPATRMRTRCCIWKPRSAGNSGSTISLSTWDRRCPTSGLRGTAQRAATARGLGPDSPVLHLVQIAGGKADRIINTDAKAAAAYKGPIVCRFTTNPSMASRDHGTPAEFVAAWRHVVDRFRAAGASNVLWVWILGSEVFREGAADGWYPGRSYVDYAGADGYNYAFARPGAQWRTVNALFSSFHAWSVQHHLPAMITETGTMEDPADPGRKAGSFNRRRRLAAHPPGHQGLRVLQQHREIPLVGRDVSGVARGVQGTGQRSPVPVADPAQRAQAPAVRRRGLCQLARIPGSWFPAAVASADGDRHLVELALVPVTARVRHRSTGAGV